MTRGIEGRRAPVETERDGDVMGSRERLHELPCFQPHGGWATLIWIAALVLG